MKNVTYHENVRWKSVTCHKNVGERDVSSRGKKVTCRSRSFSVHRILFLIGLRLMNIRLNIFHCLHFAHWIEVVPSSTFEHIGSNLVVHPFTVADWCVLLCSLRLCENVVKRFTFFVYDYVLQYLSTELSLSEARLTKFRLISSNALLWFFSRHCQYWLLGKVLLTLGYTLLVSEAILHSRPSSPPYPSAAYLPPPPQPTLFLYVQ